MTVNFRARRASMTLAITAAIALAAPCAALAQATTQNTMSTPTSLKNIRTTVEIVNIVSIDKATRHLVVRRTSGETASMKVPPSVQNFDQLKVGDNITATYQVETEFAMSPPNRPMPQDTDTLLAARARSGELPAGVVANRIVVTGAVLGIDTKANTVRVVNPQGGEVHTLDVTSPEGRKFLGQLKVGDKVTAYVTESLLISAART
jgi:hypothetical protein